MLRHPDSVTPQPLVRCLRFPHRALVEVGGVAVLNNALQNHPDDADVVEHSLGTLAQLCQTGAEHRELVVVCVPAVVAALQRHLPNPAIQLHGADIFQLLTGVSRRRLPEQRSHGRRTRNVFDAPARTRPFLKAGPHVCLCVCFSRVCACVCVCVCVRLFVCLV